MDEDILKLENQLCFPLYACAKEVIKKYKPFLDEIDLTYTQYIAMMVLWERKIMNVKDLGSCLYLDSGTLTPLLKRLETKNLIARERSSEDERQLNVVLTENGQLLKLKANEIPHKIKNCVNLSMDEANVLYKILYKLLSNMSV